MDFNFDTGTISDVLELDAGAKNLDPHFFYECPDFVVEWEVRH